LINPSFSLYNLTLKDSDGNPRNMTNSKGKKRRAGSKTLASITRCSDPKFLDFIDRCLDWDPARRINPEKALRHPFIIDLVNKASISSLEMDSESPKSQRQHLRAQKHRLFYPTVQQMSVSDLATRKVPMSMLLHSLKVA